MSSTPRIVSRNGEQVVWPGSISLPQYEARARRCSACEHRLPEERNRCALMHDRPPFNRGVAILMTHAHINCPDGRWQEEAARQTNIIAALQPALGSTPMMERIAHGASGLAKAALGIERADDATIAERYALCMTCDRNALGVCTECGCLCAAKMRVAGEACPEGKWQATAQARSS